jgi:small subunit ribosomal protein S8
MSMSDPISDMLTRLRNANRLGKEVVIMPSSNLKKALADALRREGFIEDVAESLAEEGRPHRNLRVTLKYGPDGERVMQFLDRVSRPGRRVYAGSDTLPRVLNGMGCAILSTSRGVLSDRECRRERVGGEVLCRVG